MKKNVKITEIECMIKILKNMKYEDQIKRITKLNRNIIKSNHLEKNLKENVLFIIRTLKKYGYSNLKS
jgi:hypothetical protein